MTVIIENVGRSKATWSIETWGEPRVAAEAILKAVKAKRVLASQDIDVTWHEGGESGEILVGGWRPVGTWRAVGKEETP